VATSDKTEDTLRTGERPALAPKHFAAPRIEPWLWIMFSAFIPIALIPLMPEDRRMLLVILAAIPMSVGLGILFVKHWPRD
jgi:hypothetical protein